MRAEEHNPPLVCLGRESPLRSTCDGTLPSCARAAPEADQKGTGLCLRNPYGVPGTPRPRLRGILTRELDLSASRSFHYIVSNLAQRDCTSIALTVAISPGSISSWIRRLFPAIALHPVETLARLAANSLTQNSFFLPPSSLLRCKRL